MKRQVFCLTEEMLHATGVDQQAAKLMTQCALLNLGHTMLSKVCRCTDVCKQNIREYQNLPAACQQPLLPLQAAAWL